MELKGRSNSYQIRAFVVLNNDPDMDTEVLQLSDKFSSGPYP